MKKESVKVFSVIIVFVFVVLLLTGLVSAGWWSDFTSRLKSFFGFGEKEERLEGELKSLGVAEIPSIPGGGPSGGSSGGGGSSLFDII